MDNNKEAEILQSNHAEQSIETQNNKSSKKVSKIIVPLILVLAAGIITASILNMPNQEKRTINVSDNYDKNVLVPVRKDGKFGYVDLGGNMIIEPKYDYAEYFRANKYAVVYTDNFNRASIINRSGDIVLDTEIDSFGYYDKLSLWRLNDSIYDEDLNFIGRYVEESESSDLVILQKDGDPQNRYTAYTPDKKETYTFEANTEPNTISITSTPSGQSYCAFEIQPDNPDTEEIEAIYRITNCQTGEIILDEINHDIDYNRDQENIFTYEDSNGTYGYYLVDDNRIVAQEEITIGSPDLVFASELQNSPTEGYYLAIGPIEEYRLIDESEDELNAQELPKLKYYIYATKELTETKPQTFTDLHPGYHDYVDPLGLNFYNEDYVVIENNEGKQGLRKGSKIIVDCNYDKVSFYNNWGRDDNDLIAANKDQTLIILDANTGETIANLTNKDYVGYSSDLHWFTYEKNGDYFNVFNPETRKQTTIYSPSTTTLKFINPVDYTANWIRIYNADTDNYEYYNNNLELFYFEKYYNEYKIWEKVYDYPKD